MASPLPFRFVVFHIHPLSARLRFVQSQDGHIFFPDPIPKLSELMDNPLKLPEIKIHPANFIAQLCQHFNLSNQMLHSVGPKLWLDTPGKSVRVFFLKLEMESICPLNEGERWLELPDSFSLTALERDILQVLYEWLLG